MQERRVGVDSNIPSSPFDGFGFHGRFPSLFGGKDPFDDPFFTRPSGSLFESSMFNTNPPGDFQLRSKGPVIEELDSDDERKREENEYDDVTSAAHANRNPFVEQPEDQVIDHEKSCSKHIMSKTNHNKLQGMQQHTRGVSFQRVTYGGINGVYGTAVTTRRTGDDGMTLVESQQADITTGQAAHLVSRGINDKGHTVTRTLDSDGKVETLQTLHNLNEDDLFGFEQVWKGNVDKNFHIGNGGPDFLGVAGASGSGRDQLSSCGGYSKPFKKHFMRNRGPDLDHRYQPQSSGGRPKRVVTINIE